MPWKWTSVTLSWASAPLICYQLTTFKSSLSFCSLGLTAIIFILTPSDSLTALLCVNDINLVWIRQAYWKAKRTLTWAQFNRGRRRGEQIFWFVVKDLIQFWETEASGTSVSIYNLLLLMPVWQKQGKRKWRESLEECGVWNSASHLKKEILLVLTLGLNIWRNPKL